MRNLNKTQTDPQDGLTAAGKCMHKYLKDENGMEYDNPCYVAYHAELANLQTKYNDYTAHTTPCTLEQLSTSYPNGHMYHDGLYDLYDSQRIFLKDLRKELFEQGGRLSFCPYCHSTPVQDLDHYVPRSLMPEYSVHIYNLIPLCHQCNTDKANDWLDKAGKRIYFNAFFDAAPDMADVIECKIEMDAQSSTLQVSLEIRPQVENEAENVRLAKSTAVVLNLIGRYWQAAAGRTLQSVCKQIINQYKARQGKPDFEEHYDTQMRALQFDIDDSNPVEIIQNEVKKAILRSGVFKQWAKGEITILNQKD